MDTEAIARARRRQHAVEALESERGREAALREQLEEVVTETEGPRVDEAAFARMASEDVELVRDALEAADFEADVEGDWLETGEIAVNAEEVSEPGGTEEYEEEIARLEAEIAVSRRRQQALERYLEALGE